MEKGCREQLADSIVATAFHAAAGRLNPGSWTQSIQRLDSSLPTPLKTERNGKAHAMPTPTYVKNSTKTDGRSNMLITVTAKTT